MGSGHLVLYWKYLVNGGLAAHRCDVEVEEVRGIYEKSQTRNSEKRRFLKQEQKLNQESLFV